VKLFSLILYHIKIITFTIINQVYLALLEIFWCYWRGGLWLGRWIRNQNVASSTPGQSAIN